MASLGHYLTPCYLKDLKTQSFPILGAGVSVLYGYQASWPEPASSLIPASPISWGLGLVLFSLVLR